MRSPLRSVATTTHPCASVYSVETGTFLFRLTSVKLETGRCEVRATVFNDRGITMDSCRVRSIPLLLLVLFIASPLQAAMLLRTEVVTDGIVDPPGDRIDVVIGFFPEDKDLTLTIRGFLADPAAGTSKPLPAKDMETGKSLPQWIRKVPVSRPLDGQPARVSVPVPFASLRLARGLHRVGFEVTGAQGDQIDFVEPTPLTNLQVTGDVRRSMMPPPPPMKFKPIEQKVSAYVLKDGKLQEVQAATQSEEPIFEDVPMPEIAVNIPGEFTHPLFFEAPPNQDQLDEDAAMVLPPPGAGWSSAATFVPERDRKVLFATNRVIADASLKTCARFGSTADKLSYGSAVVNIPLETHKRGELETPGYWSYPDPKKHFLVESLDPLTVEQFRQAVKADDVLLYIHGYNTSFEFAVLRGAQLIHDLEFPGKGVVFSWPSAGTLRGYGADEGQAANSIPAMKALIAELVASGIGQIHVISHSMGNRVFLGGLRQWEIAQTEKPARKILGQVMLAAPDVDAATFAALIPSVIRNAQRTTLYYCPHDTALTASQTLHLNKPVGLGPFFFDGLDTINAEKVDTTYLGHGYYAAARELLLDLRLTIDFAKPPDERRPPLGEKADVYGYPLWAVIPIP